VIAGHLDPSTDIRWRSLASRDGAGLFHSPLWLGAVRDAYDFPIEADIVTGPDGEAVAGIAYARLAGPPAERVIAAPFCDACDPLFGEPDQLAGLLASLKSHCIPVHLRCLDAAIDTAMDFSVVKRARWHRLALADTAEARWRALTPSTQRAVRKSRRSGVRIAPLDPGPDLAAFHHLHVILRKTKYRMLAQPLAFFDAIAARFKPAGKWHSLGAWIGDRLVAASIYLRWGDTLYYKFNTSLGETLDARPNDLLVWEGIELASSLGCNTLDLGPSDDDQPGLIRFKRQFGASESELRFLRHDPEGWDGAPGDTARRLLGEVAGLTTGPDLPDEVSARTGAALYRYFA